jgi:hypothetical protein
VSDDAREAFERRLLALVRHQMDFLDEDYPDGWEITEFVVTARYHTAPDADTELFAWEGGPFPGWGLNAFTRGSSPQYWHDAELLQEALSHTLRRLDESRTTDDDEDDSPDDHDTDEED